MKRSSLTLVWIGIGLVAGCNTDAPHYPESLTYPVSAHPRKDVKLTIDDSFLRKHESKLAKVTDRFGTPRAPKSGAEAFYKELSESEKQVFEQELGRMTDGEALGAYFTASHLANGSRLYRRYCLHCHGVSGDGNGPTGPFLNPKPRDFRSDLFKFRSSKVGAPPLRDDLKRTITHGVPTANMPAFNLLREQDLEDIISYVLHLSIRGWSEYLVADSINRENDYDVDEIVGFCTTRWFKDKTGDPIARPAWPALVNESGEIDKVKWDVVTKIFAKGQKGNCENCHGPDGRSDLLADNKTRQDMWGNLNPPRNFTHGAFRGGSRPIDLFHRIRSGIAAADMPPVLKNAASDEEVWLLVEYVMQLSKKR